MADDTNLDALLVAEILVVVHLARDEGVGTVGNGVVEQEVACTAADGHTADRPLQQLVTHDALNAELTLHKLQEHIGHRRIL